MEKLTVRNVGKTHEMIEEMNKQINELNKKYEIMKENAKTLSKRIDKATEYLVKHSNNCMFELRIEEMEELLDILKGVI